jgi:hypothetical protein
MNNQVYAVIQGWSCAYASGEDFESLELFYKEEDAQCRMKEIESMLKTDAYGDGDYVEMKVIEIK